MVTGDDIEDVFKCYVHDFVMYSSGSSEYNEDTKVIVNKNIIIIVHCIVSFR